MDSNMILLNVTDVEPPDSARQTKTGTRGQDPRNTMDSDMIILNMTCPSLTSPSSLARISVALNLPQCHSYLNHAST